MSKTRDLLHIARILEIKKELDECITNNTITKDLILSNRDIRWMVSMPLIDIKEQVSSLSEEFLAEHEIPDFKSIKGMRNRLVHGYGDVKYDYIAEAIFDDLPILVNRCEEILSTETDEQV